jgi:inner membrane transporter RhtA
VARSPIADPARPAHPAAPADRPSAPPELLIVAGAVSVQGGGGIAAQLLQRHGVLPVVAMRIAFSAALLLILRRPRRGVVGRSAWRYAIALGVVMAVMNSLFYLSIARIPLGVAVTIEFWGPLTLAVAGSRRLIDVSWAVLAAAGIYLLTGGRLTADDALGVAAAFAAGGCWATFILIGGRLARAWPDGRGLTVTMSVASLIVVPAALLTGGLGLLADPAVLAAGCAVALFSSTIPYTLELAAMRHTPSSTYGVLMSLEPAVAAVVGFVLLGQVLRPVDVVAIALVGVASAGSSLSARRLTVAPGELEAA